VKEDKLLAKLVSIVNGATGKLEIFTHFFPVITFPSNHFFLFFFFQILNIN